eukprot:TRINITY_DN27779_c0_g1_i1.p1 TRINITY_DN27779_c0_g1~~TRINITY_DN27779_c0_g1_i1.p1  ORF type:complete len:167 (+),score=32.67 TRINITY_DN27779_c0_g1_i1:70-501(+)
MQHSRQISFSSFPLELWLLVSTLCGVVWVLAAFSTWLYKSLVLPNADGEVALDITIIVLMILLEISGKNLASWGNLLEHKGPLLMAMLVLTVQIGTLVYTMRFQAYVLQLDLYMSTAYLIVKGIAVVLVVNQLTALSCVSQTL